MRTLALKGCGDGAKYEDDYGAAGGTRTPDPRITNALLYQLSYCGLLVCRDAVCGASILRCQPLAGACGGCRWQRAGGSFVVVPKSALSSWRFAVMAPRRSSSRSQSSRSGAASRGTKARAEQSQGRDAKALKGRAEERRSTGSPESRTKSRKGGQP